MASQNCTHFVWLHSPAHGGVNGHFQAITDQLFPVNIQCCTEKYPDGKCTVLFLLDDSMSEEQEQSCFQELLAQDRHVIVLCTGEKPLPFFRVWRLLGMGAEDVLHLGNKIRLGEFLQARLNRWATIDRLLDSDRLKKILIGNCACWHKTLRQAIEVACFSTAPVLILGESGTGKELVARLIHDLDKRPDKQDLVLLDCTTIHPELSGSEFFGHEKGAFTNAVSTRDGAFALADRGTLFLDEIGELPPRLQAELLRVSQDGVYKRVGSNLWQKTQFRLVSATNRNLEMEVEKGNFRQDLFYRVTTCVIRLPSLREHKTDVPELAAHFLAQALKTDSPPPFDPAVLHFLMNRPYPGNVRELRQLMTRLAYRHVGDGPITVGDIPPADRERVDFSENAWQENGFRDALRIALSNGVGLKDIRRIAGDVAMNLAIEATNGNLQEAAKRLDVTDRLVQGYWAERKNGKD